MKYHIYKNELDEMKKIAEEQGQPISFPFEVIERASLAQVGQHYAQTLDCNVHVVEHFWQKEGKHIVFIEDQNTIDRLMALKFKPSMVAAAPLPYKAFTIAVPKGAKYMGVPLFPALVCAYEEAHQLQDLTKEFLASINYSGLGGIDFDTSRAASDEIDITINIPEEIGTWKCAKNITNLGNEQVQKLLTLEPTDIEGMLTVFRQYKDTLHMSYQELVQQMLTIRLTMALCIYNQATEGKYLRNGVPYGMANKPKFFGMTKQDFPTFTKRAMKLEPINKGAKKGEHMVGEHMRQLVADRYYQGKFAEMPKGSRWTRIPEHLRGGGTPHTQSVADDDKSSD